ncbi:MAG: phycobilisome linker polypeptide [Cyanobacteria bacterium P01_D01_bin.36]
MLGQNAARATSLDNRIFVYEVTGLQQNEVTQYQETPIRSSSTQQIQVPFHRMNEEMQRILMMGGKIVNISSLEQLSASGTQAQAEPVEAMAE